MPVPKTPKVARSTTRTLATKEAAFRRKLPQLLLRYAGEFVALYQGRVVGHDPDDEALAQQMYAKLGDVPFYIGEVAENPRVYELPSPETDR